MHAVTRRAAIASALASPALAIPAPQQRPGCGAGYGPPSNPPAGDASPAIHDFPRPRGGRPVGLPAGRHVVHRRDEWPEMSDDDYRNMFIFGLVRDRPVGDQDPHRLARPTIRKRGRDPGRDDARIPVRRLRAGDPRGEPAGRRPGGGGPGRPPDHARPRLLGGAGRFQVGAGKPAARSASTTPGGPSTCSPPTTSTSRSSSKSGRGPANGSSAGRPVGLSPTDR